jgi:holo-[acyl-carrier protein] synthase
MIIGIGTDIVKISRIKALLVKNKQRFLAKIFTKKEIELTFKFNNLDRLSGYIAKRFAAKEASSKAFGKGIGKEISFQDIEVFQDIHGKPYLKFSDKVNKNYLLVKPHLSMTDEKEFAQAFVILEK